MAAVIPAAIMAAGMAASAGATAYAASQTPDAPDYAAANREGVLADIETLPLRKMIEAAAKLGTKVEYKDPKTGQTIKADFTGFGDVDQARGQLEFSKESAETMAKLALDLQTKYGDQYIEARLKELEASDPVGFALRKKYGETVSAELDNGYELAPGMREEVVQAERAAQAARGNILGQSSGAVEAMQTGNAAFRLYQQRLANAAAFLSGTTPVAQFGQIAGAQQGAVPVTPLAVQQGATLNANAGAAGAAYAQQNYQNQVQNNPWLNFAQELGGIGTGVTGIGAMYGVDQSIKKWGR